MAALLLAALALALALCTGGAAARKCQFNQSLPHEDGRCALFMGMEPMAVLDPRVDKMLCYWPDPKFPHSPDKWQSVQAGRAHPVNPGDWTNTSNDTSMPPDVRSRLSQPPYQTCKGSEGCCFDGGFGEMAPQIAVNVSLVPFANCTKLGHKVCYEGGQKGIEEVVKLDPLACKPPHDARLVSGSCSAAGFPTFKGDDPIFTTVGLWEKGAAPPPAPGNGTATASEFRRWSGSTTCGKTGSGEHTILSTDVMGRCTPFHIPAPASDFVSQTDGSTYASYHYQGHTDCSGARTKIGDWDVGTCSGDLGGYSQMRVWLYNNTFHCTPGCECCPCAAGVHPCMGTCPDCGKSVCVCPANSTDTDVSAPFIQ
jgi:hypothetical protein